MTATSASAGKGGRNARPVTGRCGASRQRNAKDTRTLLEPLFEFDAGNMETLVAKVLRSFFFLNQTKTRQRGEGVMNSAYWKTRPLRCFSVRCTQFVNKTFNKQ